MHRDRDQAPACRRSLVDLVLVALLALDAAAAWIATAIFAFYGPAGGVLVALLVVVLLTAATLIVWCDV
jgi:hypothetical protein